MRILRHDIDRIGFDKDFTIYDTDDSKRVIKDILKELNLDEKTFPPKSVLSIISSAKDKYENPEAFAAEMRKLVDKFEQQERTRIQKLKSLIEQYRKSSDKDERNRLKAEVAKMEKEIFNKRLAGLSRTISNAKRRVAMMEQEYKKRKAKADDIVKARVDALLTGELPVWSFPPRRNAPPRPIHPPHPRRGPGK